MSKPYATQVIQAAKVHENLVAIATTLPTSESQARPLTKLELNIQPIAWKQAVDTAPNGKVTATAKSSEEAHSQPPRYYGL